MVVMKKSWPVLGNCKKLRHQVCPLTQCYEPNDLLSPLPDEILFIIMSFLTIKEAARTSVLSHRWNYLWRHFPVLVFEDSSAMERIDFFESNESLFRLRSNFLKWVNRVVETHLGRYVDVLRVTFDLDKACQPDMDKWLLFAIAKQVKRLELNFASALLILDKIDLPEWRIPLDQPRNLPFFKSCLSSLSLKYVNVTTQDIDCLLRCCTVLENFCIDSSPTLEYIRADFPLQLKHLEVSHCICLKVIDILAPKLVSFNHIGQLVDPHIRGASMLSKLSLCHISCGSDIVTHVFDSFSKYIPQLEYISWMIPMFHGGDEVDNCFQYNLGVNTPPAMKNLKHLELQFFALCDQSLLGWADLIEASPLLQRLTLKFLNTDGNPSRKIMKRIGRPLRSLKVLELHGELGLPIDLEFVSYVVENSIMLKDVIVELRPLEYPYSESICVEDQVAKLRQIVPQGVNFTLNMV